MAIQNIRFLSRSLKRPCHFNLVLPDDAPGFYKKNNPNYQRGTKTLFLLHGYGEDHYTWLTSFNVVELAYKNNLAIVLPNGENSFYVNAPGNAKKYASLVGEEMIEYLRSKYNLATKMEDTFIAGFSMGGYGAIHLTLAYPHTFNACAAFSTANMQEGIIELTPGRENREENYRFFTSIYGDLSKLPETENDLEFQIKTLKQKQDRIPPIYLACGAQDFLVQFNQGLDKFLTDEKIPHEYYETDGGHDMIFWGEYIVKAVDWMLNK